MCAWKTGRAALKLPNPEIRNEDDTSCSSHFIHTWLPLAWFVIWNIYGFLFSWTVFIFTAHSNKRRHTYIYLYYIALSPLSYFFIIKISSQKKPREAAHNSALYTKLTQRLFSWHCRKSYMVRNPRIIWIYNITEPTDAHTCIEIGLCTHTNTHTHTHTHIYIYTHTHTAFRTCMADGRHYVEECLAVLCVLFIGICQRK